MRAPDPPSPAAPRGADRATLPSVPEGTTLLTIGRVLADSHRRGGRREHVARVTPAELRARLRAEGPGRYRVSCLDGSGCFLRGGSFVVEVPAGSLEAVVVPARKPRDYPRRGPSAAALERRGAQRIEQRVQGLQAALREANVARARLGRESAALREKHLKETLRLHEYVETLHEQVGRLADRLKQLEAREDARHRAGNDGLAGLRQILEAERRHREADVARLTADVASATAAPIPPEVGQILPEPLPPASGSQVTDDVERPSVEPTSPPSVSSPQAEAARAPGLSPLPDARSIPGWHPVLERQAPAPASPRRLGLGVALNAFWQQKPRRPK